MALSLWLYRKKRKRIGPRPKTLILPFVFKNKNKNVLEEQSRLRSKVINDKIIFLMILKVKDLDRSTVLIVPWSQKNFGQDISRRF